MLASHHPAAGSTEQTVRQPSLRRKVGQDPSVERFRARQRLTGGEPSSRRTAKSEHRFERAWSPQPRFLTLGHFPEPERRPDVPDARDISLPGREIRRATAVAHKCQGRGPFPASRATRRAARASETPQPRFELPYLGVTTSALSQTIRIATLGDIEQNSAKFSLSDRQVPIKVSLSEDARRDLATLENLPVPTAGGGSVPLKAVADIGFGSGPTTIMRSNQLRRLAVGADLAPGVVEGDVWAKVMKFVLKTCPRASKR